MIFSKQNDDLGIRANDSNLLKHYKRVSSRLQLIY